MEAERNCAQAIAAVCEHKNKKGAEAPFRNAINERLDLLEHQIPHTMA